MQFRYLIAIALILFSVKSTGQQVLSSGNNANEASLPTLDSEKKITPGLPNLKPGDDFPEFEFGKVIHFNSRRMNTAAFKDQLLIIDFWATGCSGCVEALPKMQSLQQHFGNKIRILPVTYEPEELVTRFWERTKYVKDVKLPLVVEDSVFKAYFLHKAIPHEVWIYKGKVVAITDAQYVDQNNIQRILNGEVINWPVKNDFYKFDANKQSLFTPDSNRVNVSFRFLYYAAISNYKEGVNAAGLSGGREIIRDTVNKTVRFYALNEAIYTFYSLNKNYLPRKGKLVKPSPEMLVAPNEVLWEVADKSKYYYDYKKAYQAEWVRKNGICFESVRPDRGQSDKEVYKSVVADMDALLGLKVRWEKRKEKVLLLVRTIKSDKIKSRGPLTKDEEQVDESSPIGTLRNSSLSQLIYTLNQQETNPYVFDETNYKGLVDMKLNICSWSDIPSIRKELQQYGLDLKEEERIVDKLVFSEVGRYN